MSKTNYFKNKKEKSQILNYLIYFNQIFLIVYENGLTCQKNLKVSTFDFHTLGYFCFIFCWVLRVLDGNNAYEIKNYEVSLQVKLLTEVVLNVAICDIGKLFAGNAANASSDKWIFGKAANVVSGKWSKRSKRHLKIIS